MLRAWILALSPKTASSSGWVGAGLAAPLSHVASPARQPCGAAYAGTQARSAGESIVTPAAALRQVRARPVPEQQSSASSPPFLSLSAAIRHGYSCSPPEAPGSRQLTGHLPVP